MDNIDFQEISKWHSANKEPVLSGRYITYTTIKPVLDQYKSSFDVKIIGKSHYGTPIHTVQIGNGPIKILLWSQMHGNETTGTKALFDLFRFFYLGTDKPVVKELLKKCTLVCLPILNPDGAIAYTRKSAQDIDLNRDAVDLKAPESKLLFNLLTDEKPDFCFNLHDQRTIFSVGKENLPATISFLAPSEDEARTLTYGRKRTMGVIVAMANVLKKFIPNQIGRFTDEFYPTATGDNFQKAGFPTILIEAGHYQGDYEREKVRLFNFIALLSGIEYITRPTSNMVYKPYFEIPNNEKQYLDLIFKNCSDQKTGQLSDIGILYKEQLIDNQIVFVPAIEYRKDLSNYNADIIIDKMGKKMNEKEILKLSVKK